MWCPQCQGEKTRVVGTESAILVVRFRRCPQCGYGFITCERHDFDPHWQEHAEYAREELIRLRKKKDRLPVKPEP